MSMSNTEKTVKGMRRNTRRKFSTEEKIRIVLDGLRGESSIAIHVLVSLQSQKPAGTQFNALAATLTHRRIKAEITARTRIVDRGEATGIAVHPA